MLNFMFPAHIDCLHKAAELVLAEARRRGLATASEPRLELVLEEIFVNVCHYAYIPPESGMIEIALLPEEPEAPSSLRLLFRDTGAPFNPLEDPAVPDVEASLKDRRPGGLGIFLVRQLTSKLSYRRTQDKNELCFEFQLHSEE